MESRKNSALNVLKKFTVNNTVLNTNVSSIAATPASMNLSPPSGKLFYKVSANKFKFS